MASNNYAHPEALVDTHWLAHHLKDDGIRIVESNEDILLYDTGHIPGAVHILGTGEPICKIPSFEITFSPINLPNCAAAMASRRNHLHFLRRQIKLVGLLPLWAFRLFGHDKVKILNGGRDKWKPESREMTLRFRNIRARIIR